MDASSIGGQSSIYQLIDQYMALEKIPRNKLEDQKTALKDKKSVFSDLDAKLSALKSKMSYFNDIIVNPFFAKTSSSSDTAKVNITAQGSSVSGNHTISVDRLAKADTRVSNQFTNYNSSFVGFATDQTFTIEVGHPTDEDIDNRVEISVIVSASVFSGTDDEVIAGVSTAINDAMGSAVANELIDGDEVIHSSVVNEDIGVSRLVLGSEQTGYSYRIDFGASTLLDTLGINTNALSAGTSGGYITAIGSSRQDSELNAQFLMDGLTFYRDSNVIDNALSGVTLKLLDTFEDSETVTIQTDVDTVRGDVEDFIEKYNEVMEFIRTETKTNPDTHERGALANDSVYSSIVNELRVLVGGTVEGTTSEDFSLLFNIGIESDTDGKLSIKDSDKFTAALEANALFVSDLFTSENGIASKLETYIDKFVATGGNITDSERQIDDRLSNLDDRISYMDEILEKKEEQYFNEFTELQQVMYQLQAQQQFFDSFF